MTKTEYTINFKFAFDPAHKGAPYTLDGEHYMNGGEFAEVADKMVKGFGSKKDANTPFRLMKTDRLQRILDVIPHDYGLANVAVSAIAVKWKEKLAWYPITFRPRQGGVNSINMKRICKIGWKALSDFRKINKSLKSHTAQ